MSLPKKVKTAPKKDDKPKPVTAKTMSFSSTDRDIKAPDNAGIVRFDDKFLLTSSKKLNLALGMKSLANKLGLSVVPDRIVGLKLPEDVYKLIDSRLIDTDRVTVYGTITKEMVKRYVKEIMTKTGNSATMNIVMEKGAIGAVKEGHIPIEKLAIVKQSEDIMRENKEAEEKLTRDVPNGECVKYPIPITGKQMIIVSHRNISDDSVKKDIINYTKGVGVDLTKAAKRADFVKKKHYFVYSERSGYGKSTLLISLEDCCNCSLISDFNNLAGVRENSQFLTHDEFSYQSKITLNQLKALAGGKPMFAGNKKTFGTWFKARDDMQLVIASNQHLFECVGSKYDPPK